MVRPKICAIVGGADETDRGVLEASRRLGELLATDSWILVTGGGPGVMEAASEGARRAGGLVVGILPGLDPEAANPFVGIPIATGLGEARNAVIASASDAVVAVGGEYGTLSEIALSLKLGKRVLVLHSPWETVPGAIRVNRPEEAVAALREHR